MSVAQAEPMEPDTTGEWLRHLYGDVEQGWLTLFALDRRNGARHTPWRAVDDIDGLVADAEALSEHCCVWFGTGVRKHKVSGRGKAEDVAALPGLWVDIDIEGENHKGAHALPKSLDEAWLLVRDFPVPPTAVVVTGGGLQPWWLLKEPLGVEDGAAEILTQWGHTWAELARRRGWHVDNVFDLPRVMRLPGTLNRKHGGADLVTVVEAHWGRRYNPGDLEGHMLDAPEPTRAQPQERVPYIGPQRPGDAFNAQRRGAELLERVGFVFARRDPNGDEHFVRPGKDKRDGTSATVYADDGHTTIWSDTVLAQWPALETQRPYDAFGLYCALFHGGDWTAATQELSRQGYGERSIERDDFSWVATGEAGDAVAEPATVVDIQWSRPIDLGRAVPAPYPLDILPAWIADYCCVLAEEMQVPVDLCAQVALGAWSAACATKIKVAFTESYQEHVNLFLATAMPSGSGKSPVSKALTRPLRTLERELIDTSRPVVAEAKARRKVLERGLAQATKDSDVGLMADYELQLEMHEVPHTPRLIVDDVTPEKLSVVLAEQKGRMALISTEATVFSIACGLYSAKTPNNGVFLQGWGGEEHIVDRKGASSVDATSIRIKEAVLTVAITVQPAMLEELKKHPLLQGQGFTARFMYSLPDSMIGGRNHWKILDASNTAASLVYEQTFLDFTRRFNRWQEPAVVRCSDEARHVFLEWKQALEPMLPAEGRLGHVGEWTAKLFASVIRVAGLLHLAQGHDHKVWLSGETMAQAIRLGEYWISHALVAAQLWQSDEVGELAAEVVRRRFVDEGITEFDSSAPHRDWHKKRMKRMAEERNVQPPDITYDVLLRLVEHGYIAPADGQDVQRPGVGKRAQQFVVNPLIREMGSLGSSEGCFATSGSLGSSDDGSSPETSLKGGALGSSSLKSPFSDSSSSNSSSLLSISTQEEEPKEPEVPERPPGWSLIGDPDDEGAA